MVSWPKLFHRVWLDEPERPEFAAWRDQLAKLHPAWVIETQTDSSELNWLINQKQFDEALERDPFGRAPDILRYELLWKFGGIYIDTDFEVLKPLDCLIEDGKPFAGWENEATMCTAMLGAPPRHPAIGELIERLPKRLAKTWKEPANYAVGPEYAGEYWREREDVKRLPVGVLYPIGWWQKHKLGKTREYAPWTLAVHHWNKGWEDPDGPRLPGGRKAERTSMEPTIRGAEPQTRVRVVRGTNVSRLGNRNRLHQGGRPKR